MFDLAKHGHLGLQAGIGRVGIKLDIHKSQMTFADLLKASLRHRPDRIIVGEMRGGEARVFLDALNTGHRGSLSTIHANGAKEALHRLAQLAMRVSGNLLLPEIEEECRRSVHLNCSQSCFSAVVTIS